MHSITVWNWSRGPNYVTNVDKIFPYSEVPYIGNYHLVKIPLENLIELVDYWGEGRIEVKEGISGFRDSYNVNHQYQLVSNGPDSNRKIPNRIPVISYTNCDTSSYIKANSVKIVTLMGAPINKSCAEDIGRMVNENVGKVVVYGFNDNTADIRNLNDALSKKGILHCPGYTLPDLLNGLTLYDSYKAYLNSTELSQELSKKITEADYENAVTITTYFDTNAKSNLISEVVNKLLKDGVKNLMGYAYKLWNSNSKDIVINHFPTPFKHILNGDFVKIIDKKNMLALKLDSNVDSNNDRIAWSDKNENSNNKVQWKIIPIWENNQVLFKIKNVEHDMLLKLDSTEDQSTKRAMGTNTANLDDTDSKLLWTLEPFKVDDDLLFIIVNFKYNQRLKLDENVDTNVGDRKLLGENDSSLKEPEKYGWYVAPYE